MLGEKTSVKLRDYAFYSSIYPAGDCVMRIFESNINGLIKISGCSHIGVDYCYDKIMSRRDTYHRRGLYKIKHITKGGSNPTVMQLMIYSFIFGVSIGDLFDPMFDWRWGVDFSLGDLYGSLRNGEIAARGGDDEFIAMALRG